MSRLLSCTALLLLLSFSTVALAQSSVSVTAADGVASEAGPEPETLTFTRTGDTSTSLNVDVLASGSVSWAVDLTSPDIAFLGSNRFRVTIPSGSATRQVVLNPQADNLVEGTEDITFTVQPPASGNAYTVGSPSSASVDIQDDPVEVTIAVGPSESNEAGQVPAIMTVTRSDQGNTAANLSVELRGTGSATWSVDLGSPDTAFLGANRFRVTIPANALSKQVILTPETDNRLEGTEDFEWVVQPGVVTNSEYTIGTADTAGITILDDPAEVTVVTVTPEATEAGQGPAIVTVSRTDQGDTTTRLSVELRGVGSATWSQDLRSPDAPFLGSNRFRVTIPANQLSKQVILTPETDNLVEGTEDFEFTVQPPAVTNSDYTIGAANAASIDILDDAAVVTLTIADASIREKGDTDTVMEIRRTDQGDTTRLLNVEISGTGTASWVLDLNAPGLSFLGSDRYRLSIPANQLSRSVVIETDFDNVDEGDESITFEVQPGQVTNSEYLIGNPSSATLLIIDVGSLVFKDGIEEALPE